MPQRNGTLSQKTSTMNYIYAPESVAERESIFREVVDVIGDENRLEMFRDIDGFSARLRRFNSPEIIIVLAVGKGEMPSLISLRDIFRDAAIIIILSDEEPNTITTAMRMRPKFLGVMNDDLDKIVPVVHKLVRKKNFI